MFFSSLLKNNWAVLTWTRNVIIYYYVCSLLACTGGHIWIPCLYVIKNSCSYLLQVMLCQISTVRGSISWCHKVRFQCSGQNVNMPYCIMCGIPNQSPFESFWLVQGRVAISIRTRVTSILVKHFSGNGNLKVQNALSLKVSDIVRKTSIFITYI